MFKFIPTDFESSNWLWNMCNKGSVNPSLIYTEAENIEKS